MAAKCSKCGAGVNCSCQLKGREGLCPSCYSVSLQIKK